MSLMNSLGVGLLPPGACAGGLVMEELGDGVAQRRGGVAGERGELAQSIKVIVVEVGYLVEVVEAETVGGSETGQVGLVCFVAQRGGGAGQPPGQRRPARGHPVARRPVVADSAA